MNTIRKNRIENYMRFYKRKKLSENYYGYINTKDFKLVAITNGISVVYLRDDFKGIKENGKLGNGLMNSILDKILSLKDNNYTELDYEEIKDFRFKSDRDNEMGFDITLVYKVVGILGSERKCKFYVIDTQDYLKKVLIIENDKKEYGYILPYIQY